MRNREHQISTIKALKGKITISFCLTPLSRRSQFLSIDYVCIMKDGKIKAQPQMNYLNLPRQPALEDAFIKLANRRN